MENEDMNRARRMKWLHRTLIFLIIAVLVCVDLVLVRRVRLSGQEIRLKDSVMAQNAVAVSRLNYLESSLSRVFKYDDSFITPQSVTDTSGNAVSVKELVRDGSVLVLRYSDGNCPACVSFALFKMNELAERYRAKLVIFAHYPEHHPFKMDNRSLNVKSLSFYNVPEVSVLDELGVPYCFILREDLSMTRVFVPDKSFPNSSTRYFEIIQNQYLSE